VFDQFELDSFSSEKWLEIHVTGKQADAMS